MDNNLAAQRAARRFLTERVRSDWDWPKIPECWSASDEEVRGITEFRERFYGDSATESEPETYQEQNISPYKFDSPDSVGDAVELKSQNRKRRRWLAVEHEMEWNKGLACFVERRDVWTGAAAVKKYGTNRPSKGEREKQQPTLDTPSDGPINNIVNSPEAKDELAPQKHTSASNDTHYESRVPVAQPLLADNPIRKSVMPKTYPDLYSKIVVSGRTPAVPINLSDMTRAMVVGWKESGEWPPKAAPLDPLAGRKKVDAVNGTNGEGQFLSHHPHMKRGMDSVKRIFHLNGHHHEHGPVGHTG
ncbi:hypothetical protein B0J11DRAFT_109703 [Dendryphion nanum]|uniref:Gag1-like clamp domain-containing protein n=1 Tax=Dendryphion nanum TaxID=256645 RepID=A0A9P9DDQ5_9PLEO|nr:hypothetical protein B0J11DRAFT_109703 [Dendryphion nanum]